MVNGIESGEEIQKVRSVTDPLAIEEYYYEY